MTAPSPLAEQYVVLAENGVGGKALEAVSGLLRSTPAELIDLAASAPAGADGVLFLPWLVGRWRRRPMARPVLVCSA